MIELRKDQIAEEAVLAEHGKEGKFRALASGKG
jgi:hypothetical protein